MGLLMLVARDFTLLPNFPDECFRRYLMVDLFLGLAAAAGLLLPLLPPST